MNNIDYLGWHPGWTIVNIDQVVPPILQQPRYRYEVVFRQEPAKVISFGKPAGLVSLEPVPGPDEYMDGRKVPANGFQPPLDVGWLHSLIDCVRIAGSRRALAEKLDIHLSALNDALDGRELAPGVRSVISAFLRAQQP